MKFYWKLMSMPKLIPEYKELIKTKIIQAAGRAFVEKGFRGATMDDIAGNAGLSKPTLYAYFKNKQDILRAGFKSMGGVLNPQYYEGRDLDALEEISDVIIGLKDVIPLTFEILSLTSTDEDLREIYLDYYNGMVNSLEIFLKKQQDKGTVRGDIDAHTLATILMDIPFGIYVQLTLTQSDESIKEYWSNALEAVLKK